MYNMREKKVGIFIQARSKSSRFPGKIYEKIHQTLACENNTSILEHIYFKLANISNNYLTVVLVPENDDTLISFCQERNISMFKGPELDVRERYRLAAAYYDVDVVLRATADNPCVDPDITRETIESLMLTQVDLFSFGNLPLGVGTEAMLTEALMSNVIKDSDEQREHVSLHIKSNPRLFTTYHPDHMVIENIFPNHFNAAVLMENIRLTVDTPEDLQVVRAIFSCLGDDCRLNDILQLYWRYPDFFTTNQHIQQVQVARALVS